MTHARRVARERILQLWLTMSLEPQVFRRVPRVFVVPEAPRRVEVIETTGVEVLDTDAEGASVPPASQHQHANDAPVPFASTLRHI